MAWTPGRSWFELPRDVRDAIYTELYREQDAIDINIRCFEPFSLHSPASTARSTPPGSTIMFGETLGLLMCNHRVSREAAKVLYGSNRFIAQCPKAFHQFLTRIGAENRKWIIHLRIYYNWSKSLDMYACDSELLEILL